MSEKKSISKEDMRPYCRVTDRTWLQGRSLAEVVEEALEGRRNFFTASEKNAHGRNVFGGSEDKKAIAVKVPCPLCHQ